VTGWSSAGTSEWGGRPLARSVAQAHPRRRALLTGTVRTVRARTGPGVQVEADLDDGTGRLALCWLGRHRVPGVAAGSLVVVEGTVVERRGRPMILNPRYEVLAGPPTCAGC